tara:strand:- start:140 stop:352 length:213 start_codon:yes stop_codon:yes gene_type:complete
MPDASVTAAIKQQALDGIRRVSGDDGSTEMMKPSEQLLAARASCAQDAVIDKKLGIRMMKIRTGNALGQV